MKPGKPMSAFSCSMTLFVLVLSLLLAGRVSAATSERVLHTFGTEITGFPSSTLVADAAGNLYGVTAGSVYELSPIAGGGWRYQLLKILPGGRGDFAGGTLALDAAGNLYGATWQGGTNSCGFVYKVSPNSAAQWALTKLHDFTCTDGAAASLGLIFDAKGNLYGGAHNGGSYSEGVAYELSPGANGQWTYKVLHEFSNAEGNGPQTALILDNKGNLLGGNESGVFELTPSPDGTWTESTAFAFNDATGFNPLGDLIFDAAGNLYGTNQAGGQYGSGAAFMLSPNTTGGWAGTVIHSFNYRNTNDGFYPEGALVFDSAGNLYGTTTGGGGSNNSGIVYELTPSTSGAWTESVVHRFGPIGSAGGTVPVNALYLDQAGSLYGVTSSGGDHACYTPSGGCGIVFKIVR